MIDNENIYYTSYDILEENYLTNLQLELDRINEEFDNFIIENELEEFIIDESATSTNWYNKMKTRIINNIEVSINNMKNFARRQLDRNAKLLINNKEIILNNTKYPVKADAIPQTPCPNYKTALNRIDMNIAGSLNGIDLNKIDGENKDNSNSWLKHYLIPTYQTGNFIQIAKMYYYGNDGKKLNMNSQMMSDLFQNAYMFCNTFSNRILTLETEAKTIIGYINRDPNTAQVEKQTKEDLQKINMMKMINKMDISKAGTNPLQNAGLKPMNADVQYDLFRLEYFSDILTEDERQSINNNLSANQNINTNQNQVNVDGSQNTIMKGNKQTPYGTPISGGLLAHRKKQVACEIIKDCFNAKVSAVGLLYRDFIHLISAHVNSYRNNNNKKNLMRQMMNQTINKNNF